MLPNLFLSAEGCLQAGGDTATQASIRAIDKNVQDNGAKEEGPGTSPREFQCPVHQLLPCAVSLLLSWEPASLEYHDKLCHPAGGGTQHPCLQQPSSTLVRKRAGAVNMASQER